MFQVAGSVAVVTGGASGIGAALARRFATAGAAAVVVADLDADGATRLAAELPVPGLGLALDATDEAGVAAAVARIEREVGPVDLWCSNAGVAGGPGLGADADWDRCWRLHVLAHLLAARHVLPGMLERRRGHLLITASAAGLLTEPDAAPYAVTKHASVALAEWLAIQHGGDSGVSFSCVCPMGVDTPLLAGAQATANAKSVPTHLPDPLHAAARFARRRSGPGQGARPAGAVIPAEEVADAVLAGLAAGRFLILPHPEVAEFERRRAADRDRWLAGMRRALSRAHGS